MHRFLARRRVLVVLLQSWICLHRGRVLRCSPFCSVRDRQGVKTNERPLDSVPSTFRAALHDRAAHPIGAHVLEQLPEQIDLRRTVDVGGGCGDGCRRSVLVVLHLVGSQRCDELRVFRKQQAARDAREGPRDAQAVPHQLDGLDLVHLVEDDVRHAPAGQLPGPVCGVAFRGRRPDGHERIALVDDVLELDSKMEGHQALCLCLGS
mmetsp:Transcript_4762/g.19066  ORF Transcript_4762/g.19066 Transcript_4762/m.19066 type:complete len:207 (+) Transcript_4762:690-1310(+)